MDLPPLSDSPASATQLAAALAALGLYGGTNTAAEHAAEALRLGGPEPYRMQLANALLGAVQVEAMLAESAATRPEDLAAAHHQQLATAGVADDVEKLAGFLRWQALRVAGPLRLVAQDPATGPIPLAAAHTAEGLQKLLGIAGTGQVPDVDAVKEGVAEMRAARQCLVDAIDNVDILLEMLSGLSAFLDKD
ncbi:hypothetical protein FHR32_006845 [Streptosporangium album]|uniref:Uncharacterized protein n=1 Tax=Streptosporangium album TaxID=47479 RepID=A0A7W7S209_9ACTN|nr:DUF6245 family protein [Streptosporangium album]MBB4942459.1 hypothetical protein [Streptosporangium album]